MARPRDPLTALDAAQRDAHIVGRRADKASFQTIGDELSISPQRVHQLWTRCLERIPAQQLDQMRVEELPLIEQAQRDLIRLAADETASARSRAEVWTAIRGWSEYRSKIVGLYAPSRASISVLTTDLISDAISQLQAEISAGEALAAAEAHLANDAPVAR